MWVVCVFFGFFAFVGVCLFVFVNTLQAVLSCKYKGKTLSVPILSSLAFAEIRRSPLESSFFVHFSLAEFLFQ